MRYFSRFSPLMLFGLLATIFLIPPTRGADGKPLSLEQLAAEDGYPKNKLSQNRKGKQKAVIIKSAEGVENSEHVAHPAAARQNGIFRKPDGSGGFEMDQIPALRHAQDPIDQIAWLGMPVTYERDVKPDY